MPRNCLLATARRGNFNGLLCRTNCVPAYTYRCSGGGGGGFNMNYFCTNFFRRSKISGRVIIYYYYYYRHRCGLYLIYTRDNIIREYVSYIFYTTSVPQRGIHLVTCWPTSKLSAARERAITRKLWKSRARPPPPPLRPYNNNLPIRRRRYFRLWVLPPIWASYPPCRLIIIAYPRTSQWRFFYTCPDDPQYTRVSRV